MEKLEKEEILYRVEARDFVLYIIYNKLRWGLNDLFSSDERMAEYIWKDTQEAYGESIKKYEKNSYLLNIASVEDFGAFPEGIPDKSILDFQLRIYMPIIQMFMVNALSDTLDRIISEKQTTYGIVQ